MIGGRQKWVESAALRAGGVVLIGLGALAMRLLVHRIQAPPAHEASPVDMALAALGFFALSAGATVAWLGRHVFDPVPVSERWAVRSRRLSGVADRAAGDATNIVPFTGPAPGIPDLAQPQDLRALGSLNPLALRRG